jgi:hypothetical protein
LDHIQRKRFVGTWLLGGIIGATYNSYVVTYITFPYIPIRGCRIVKYWANHQNSYTVTEHSSQYRSPACILNLGRNYSGDDHEKEFIWKVGSWFGYCWNIELNRAYASICMWSDLRKHGSYGPRARSFADTSDYTYRFNIYA